MATFSIKSLVQAFLTPVTLARLIPIGVVLLTGIVVTTWTHELLEDHRDLVVHTHEAIEMAKDVLIGLDDAETGQRGYLLSGDRRYLGPYEHARERLATMLPSLRVKVSDNEAQIARVDVLDTLAAAKLGELQSAIDIHDREGPAAAVAAEIASMERATMDTIRREIGDITEGEKALLEARDAVVEADEGRVRLVAILVGLASLATRTGVEIYITRKGLHLRPPTAEEEAAFRAKAGV